MEPASGRRPRLVWSRSPSPAGRGDLLPVTGRLPGRIGWRGQRTGRIAYSLVMPEESLLLIPLRSNGNALLAGKPVESVRRRLKFASLYFDHIFLEGGTFRMSAGPDGSFGFAEPPREGEVARWQTPQQRGAEQRHPFTLSAGEETTPGVPAETMHPFLHSETSMSWTATLEPFARELPADTDWISFTPTRDPEGEMRRISDGWKRADERNPALERAIPVQFARNAVIGHASRDLGFAAQHGLGVSMDPLHHQVVAQRFHDGDGWRLRGFAVPILFPEIDGWPWEGIASLRRDQGMVRLREILRQVEDEVTAESAAGDIESAAHHAYERHLATASGTVESLGAVVRKTSASVIFSAATGAAMLPLPSVEGFVIGTGVGTGITVIGALRDRIKTRRSRAWVSLAQWISQVPRL